MPPRGRPPRFRAPVGRSQEAHRRPATLKDVLVVTPYNAQVRALIARARRARRSARSTSSRAGGPRLIYSMATSSPEDAPRGMEFLYNLNRLNVATSRARCVAASSRARN